MTDKPFRNLLMAETRKVPRTAFLDKCPICAGKDTKLYFKSPDRLHDTPGNFSYHLCDSCKTVFQNPMVIQEDLHLCYPSEYTPYNYKKELPDVNFETLPNGTIRNNLRKAIVEVVKGKSAQGLTGIIGKMLARSAYFRERAFYGLVIDQLLPKGTGKQFALDVGCGTGWLIEKLKKVGWEVEGVEWNEAAAQKAREETNCRIWTGDFRKLQIPKEKYHLVVLNHVFEHFSDPKEVLILLSELLDCSGKIILFYPNPHSFGASWHKTNWFPWEVPRHLVFPTLKGLKLIAEAAGFSKTTVITRVAYSSVQWISSKAYQNQQHPDKVRPDLSLTENIGLFTEYLLTRLRFAKGCEIVAVLEK